MLPVVLAGGVGSRLWPLSTPSSPKQFVVLPGRNFSLFTQTLQRLQRLPLGLSAPIVVCNDNHKEQALQQLLSANIHEAQMLLESVGRNTAPAVALAAFHACGEGNDPLLLICPADHVIENDAAFAAALEESLPIAEAGYLVTFGVTPTRPETGYGYLERGEPLSNCASWKVVSFTEKPDEVVAKSFVKSQYHFWNSGIFVFRASNFLAQLKEFAPDIFRACQTTYGTAEKAANSISFSARCFESCPSESIDRAVMEKTQSAAVVEVAMGWSDLGSWEALDRAATEQDNGAGPF